MKRFFRLVCFLSLLGAYAFPAAPGAAQTPTVLPVQNVAIDYELGQDLTIQASFPGQPRPDKVQVYLQAAGSSLTWSAEANLNASGRARFSVSMEPRPIRTFSELTYWFEAKLPTGQQAQSPSAQFTYLDNRFTWESRQSGPFNVYWYSGDTDFAQNALDVAQAGLDNIQSLLPLGSPSQVEIYMYARGADMRTALQYATQNWVGAHADPDLGVMLVSLPPGPEQRLEMERQIPHEMMHILLYQEIGQGYLNLPTWLNEGLASVAELYPNPDYYVLLEKALQTRSMIPIQSLCGPFPREASAAYLAYAESGSFTRYLYRQYGQAGLHKLVQAYAQGVECERGIELAFESSLSQVEREWRQDTFGENAWGAALTNLAPWLVVLVLLIGLPLFAGWRALRRPALAKSA